MLTARDEALLRGIGRFRVARTSDLLRVYFPGVRRDTAMRRLRQLLDGRYLDVCSPAVDEENLYSLGEAGRAWMAERGIAYMRPPAPPLAHHLETVRVWTKLAAALCSHPAVRLRRFRPDWECRKVLAGRIPSIVPDAAITLERTSDKTAIQIALEVDLGTERHGALTRKLAAYDPTPHFDEAEDSPIILAVLFAGGEGRRQAIERLVTDHWPGTFLVLKGESWPAALLEFARIRRRDPPDGLP